MTESTDRLLALVAQIVSAHVGHNTTPNDALPTLIREVYDSLASVDQSSRATGAPSGGTELHAPARSRPRAGTKAAAISEDHLVCLEDGLSMKMLKRHLITVHGLTPDQYRAKWGLPSDYPMVAANYAKLRSSLAKESGLGLRPEARRLRSR
jgi:predicted transcriptional regulator